VSAFFGRPCTDLRGFVELVEELVERLDAVVQSERLGVFTEELGQLQSHLFQLRHLHVDDRQSLVCFLHVTAFTVSVSN